VARLFIDNGVTPARLTAAGLVLLAAQPEPRLAAWLDGCELAAWTPFTQTNPARLLQNLDTVREQGWALVDQQAHAGQRGVAVPLTDLQGQVVGAIEVGLVPSGESPTAALGRVLPSLLATARSARPVL